jgi:hypothetical protein
MVPRRSHTGPQQAEAVTAFTDLLCSLRADDDGNPVDPLIRAEGDDGGPLPHLLTLDGRTALQEEAVTGLYRPRINRASLRDAA